MLNDKITICIQNSNPKLQKIAIHIRQLIHLSYPNIEENIKWNYPSFEINGKIVITLMILKNHINITFQNGVLIINHQNVLVKFGDKSNMKGFKHIKKISDLPSDEILKELINEAIAINSK
ncbi:MAG: DUF1801 domain-containing protein [Flavobacteriaceae bacterium]